MKKLIYLLFDLLIGVAVDKAVRIISQVLKAWLRTHLNPRPATA